MHGFLLGEKKLKFLGFLLEKYEYCLLFCNNQKVMSLSLTVNDAVANSLSFISAQTISICVKVDYFGLPRKNDIPINRLVLSVP